MDRELLLKVLRRCPPAVKRWFLHALVDIALEGKKE